MADQRLTQLTADTSPADSDIIYGVKDPAGTPLSRKYTWTTVKAFLKTYFDTIYGLFINLPPSPTLVSLASKGGVFNGGFELGTGTANTDATWIGNEKYGWILNLYAAGGATAGSATYDNTVSHSGGQSMKIISTTCPLNSMVYAQQLYANVAYYDVTDLSQLFKMVRAKANTLYKFSGWIKTSAITTSNSKGARILFMAYGANGIRTNDGVYSSYISGTSDWTYVEISMTTPAGTEFIDIGICIESETGTAWFDDLKLQEVSANTTSISTPTQLEASAVAVNTIDSIDQSNYAGANDRGMSSTYPDLAQQFIPTKKYLTQTILRLVKTGAPTGNLTIKIYNDNGSNAVGSTLIASKTLDVSTLTTSYADYAIDLPCILTPGSKYFIVLRGYDLTWNGGTVSWQYNSSGAAGLYNYYSQSTAENWTGGSTAALQNFKTLYAKKTEEFSLILNGVKTQLKADNDGLLGGAIIDLDKGKYKYDSGVLNTKANCASFVNNVYQASDGLHYLSHDYSNLGVYINGWDAHDIYGFIGGFQTASTAYLTLKINTILPAKSIRINAANHRTAAHMIQYSFDNINWVTLMYGNTPGGDLVFDGFGNFEGNGNNIFYIRLYKDTTNESNFFCFGGIKIEADINISKIPVGLIYPLSSNQFSNQIKLPSVATRAYYRLNKFQNENGVVMPAIEFTDGSANYISHICLPIDNSRETNPAIDIIIADTTNGQQTGTGSNDGSTGYILNDGEYMTLSSTEDDIKITYKVGTGTTTFANITKNVIYTSSNGDSNDATQDPSLQGSWNYAIKNQGLQQNLNKTQDIINRLRKHPALDHGENVGSGTFYTLTTSLAALSFGTSGNLEIALPEPGIYEIDVEINEQFASVTNTVDNFTTYQLYKDGVFIPNSERLGWYLKGFSSTPTGANAATFHYNFIVSCERAGNLISVYGKKQSSTTGAWIIASDTNGRSRISYKKIG